MVSAGGGFYAEPADISIKTGGVDSSGVGAIINLKGNNPTYQIDTTLNNAAVNFTEGETVTSNSGMSATVTNSFKKASGGVIVLHVHNHNQAPATTDVFTGVSSGAQTNGTNTVTQRSTQSSGDTTFGGILTYKVNAGGSAYVNPQFTVSGTVGIASGETEHSAGSITSAYSTNPGYGYRKEFTPNADIQITVTDTIATSDTFVDTRPVN